MDAAALAEGAGGAARSRRRGASRGTYLGTVEDPDGDPIPGATLTIYPNDLGDWREQEPLAVGTSDGEGAFAIPVPAGLDTERYLLIQAEAEGHSTLSMDPIRPDLPMAITLNWTTTVFGRVVDAATYEPLAGTEIGAWAMRTTSDAHGNYHLPGIPVARRVQLIVTKEGYAGLDEYRELGRRGPTELTIRLHRGAPLRVQVFDFETGAPLPGVQVSPLAHEDQPFTESGEEYECDVAWTEETDTIRGFVFDVDGDPVAEQSVSARGNGTSGRRLYSSARTDSDGAFEIEVLPDRLYHVSAYHPVAGDSVEDVPAGAEGIELVLPATGRVRVRLVDATTGDPVISAASSTWGLAWREGGAEAFRKVRDSRVVDNSIELEVPLRGGFGTIDLAVQLNEDGCRPRRVLGLPVTPLAETPPVTTVELERGVDGKLHLTGDESLTAELQRGHLFFLLHDDQLASLRGPFPRQGEPSNHRINGINMWVGEPGLLYQMPEFGPTGFAFLQALKPGRYTLKSFPDDFVFTPASFEIVEDQDTVEIRWQRR